MKPLLVIITCLTLYSCNSNYELTTFYVKNNTDQTVNFKASVEKMSTMGAYAMTLPFTVLPNDSVLARKANFRKGISPTLWFTQFILFPLDSVALNDPNDAENWVKTIDSGGKQVYTFTVAK